MTIWWNLHNAVALVVAVTFAMSAHTNPHDVLPPATPDRQERPASTAEVDASSQSQEIRRLSSTILEGQGFRGGAARWYISKKWGLVFRQDFSRDGTNTPKFTNRIICWSDEHGRIRVRTEIGQDIEPLVAEGDAI